MILSASTVGCSGSLNTNGVVTPISGLTCTNSGNLQYQGSAISTGVTDKIVLLFGNVNGPSSTAPTGFFGLETYDSSNRVIDSCSSVGVNGLLPNVITLN
jgi:hypothetical protein